MKQSYVCPRCESPFQSQGNGLRGQLPNPCPQCGIKRFFDTAGGVYAFEERDGVRGEWIEGEWHRQDGQP